MRPTVLAFGAAPDYDERRRVLLERGLLSEHVSLLNIYDHYREHGWGDDGAGGRARGPERPPRGRGGAAGRHAVADRLPAPGRAGSSTTTCAPTGRRTCGSRSSASPRRRAGAPRSTGSAPTARRSASSARSASGSGTSSASWRASGPSCSSTRASWSRTSSRCASAASTSSTRCTTCTWSRRGAGTRRCTRSTAACWRGSTTWTRSSTSPSASATTSRRAAGARPTCSSSPTRSTCRPLPDPPPARDPHRVVTMARLETQKRLMHAISAFGASSRPSRRPGSTSTARAASATSSRPRSSGPG